MLMSWIWAAMVLLSVVAAAMLGNGSALSGAILDGAQSGVTLIIGMAGAICLWSGVGQVM
jgi:spore maturation protein A